MSAKISNELQERLVSNLEKSALHLRDYLKTLKAGFDNRHYAEVALLADEQEELAMKIFHR